MSGGISFSENNNWIVATWVYRHLIEHAQKHVSKDLFPNLYALLSDDENPLHFISFDELNSEEKRNFLSAVLLAYNDIIEDNGKGFVTGEYYSNYLERLKELMEMLPREDKM